MPVGRWEKQPTGRRPNTNREDQTMNTHEEHLQVTVTLTTDDSVEHAEAKALVIGAAEGMMRNVIGWQCVTAAPTPLVRLNGASTTHTTAAL